MIAVLLCSCASVKNYSLKWRKAGQTQLDPPEVVWRNYACQNEDLPLVRIERNELMPQRFEAGKEGVCNHRLVYGLCSQDDADEIVGQLYTRFYYRGRNVGSVVNEDYTLKPGRWIADLFITIPEKAKPGVYTLEVEFESPDTGFKVNNTFYIEQQKE